MRQHHLLAIAACLCSAAVVLVSAVPLPAGNQELDVLQIPLSDGKEIDVLTLGAKDQEQIIAERNKRTIGLLRELFPDITKTINEEVNRFVNRILQEVGPIILGTVLNPTLNAGRRANNTAPVDFNDDDDDVDDNNAKGADSNKNDTGVNTDDFNYESGTDGAATEYDSDEIPETVFVPDAEFGRKKKSE
ncbi:uncharacterized protein LOC125778279 isoform X3 [Bactrocera dorsalis]|uniref:Uncharacterized protein LOC125778279 isoform X3 n=1 Tax=Bactrocera dorsalis TaxID=27457 RepID=A0ABM3JP86_BACDO|nr:uncharacterized protein LOC125778279 isoform X3 [Bactrocera dorsalis]